MVVMPFLMMAQEAEKASKWSHSGLSSLTYSQTNFADWATGGVNSYSINGLFNLEVKWAGDKANFENYLDLGYGMVDNASDGLRKGEDKIDFTSKYGLKASDKWFYAAMFNFKSQMDAGFDYGSTPNSLTSQFLAPGYFNFSLGMEYKPSADLFVMISPLSAKITVVNNDDLVEDYGVELGENTRTEAGGNIKIQYNKSDIVKNVGLKTKLELFSNYAENPENIDVNYEILLSMKVNEWLSATFNAQVIYDHDVQLKTQYKHILGAGLAYRFASK